MALFVNPEGVSVRELRQLSNDNDSSVQRMPFGPFGVQTIIRDAVPWKGVSGIENVRDINEGVADGLENAIGMSKDHTENGVAALKWGSGVVSVMPRKSAEMAVEANDDAEIIDTASGKQAYLRVMQNIPPSQRELKLPAMA